MMLWCDFTGGMVGIEIFSLYNFLCWPESANLQSTHATRTYVPLLALRWYDAESGPLIFCTMDGVTSKVVPATFFIIAVLLIRMCHVSSFMSAAVSIQE